MERKRMKSACLISGKISELCSRIGGLHLRLVFVGSWHSVQRIEEAHTESRIAKDFIQKQREFTELMICKGAAGPEQKVWSLPGASFCRSGKRTWLLGAECR